MVPEEPQFLYLTTRGRRTGQPREIEIWFTQRQGRYYIIAEYSTSHWVQNIRRDPRVGIRVADVRTAARARLLEPSRDLDLIATVQELSRQKFGWGEGLVVELTPE
jgi:deazaflavin-dependent oxidoreductase (nitroreductase family)